MFPTSTGAVRAKASRAPVGSVESSTNAVREAEPTIIRHPDDGFRETAEESADEDLATEAIRVATASGVTRWWLLLGSILVFVAGFVAVGIGSETFRVLGVSLLVPGGVIAWHLVIAICIEWPLTAEEAPV